jgi:hypothetical protein
LPRIDANTTRRRMRASIGAASVAAGSDVIGSSTPWRRFDIGCGYAKLMHLGDPHNQNPLAAKTRF